MCTMKLLSRTSITLGALAALALPASAQLAVGDPAPNFEAEWLNFEEGHSLADLRGRVVLIDFWRTW